MKLESVVFNITLKSKCSHHLVLLKKVISVLVALIVCYALFHGHHHQIRNEPRQ